MSKEFNTIDAILGGSDPESTVKRWLDTGYPPLNFALSGRYDGGLPVGRMVEMFGPSSSGKTAVATKAMIGAQQAGGIAMFSDHEHSFSHALAEKLGLDLTPGRFIYKKPKTFEEALDMAEELMRIVREKKLIPVDAPIVIVFDSLAAMVPKSKMYKDKNKEKGQSELGMHDKLALATATSQSFPTMMQKADEYQALLLFLNQIRLKPGVMFGDPTTTPGGNAPEFYCSTRISLGGSKLYEGEGDAKTMVGQEITAKVIKNKVARPFLKAKWEFRFDEKGNGYFDVTGSLIDFLLTQDILKKEGHRVVWTDGKKYYKKELIKKIDSEGLLSELKAMMPTTVAESDEAEGVTGMAEADVPAEA